MKTKKTYKEVRDAVMRVACYLINHPTLLTPATRDIITVPGLWSEALTIETFMLDITSYRDPKGSYFISPYFRDMYRFSRCIYEQVLLDHKSDLLLLKQYRSRLRRLMASGAAGKTFTDTATKFLHYCSYDYHEILTWVNCRRDVTFMQTSLLVLNILPFLTVYGYVNAVLASQFADIVLDACAGYLGSSFVSDDTYRFFPNISQEYDLPMDKYRSNWGELMLYADRLLI